MIFGDGEKLPAQPEASVKPARRLSYWTVPPAPAGVECTKLFRPLTGTSDSRGRSRGKCPGFDPLPDGAETMALRPSLEVRAGGENPQPLSSMVNSKPPFRIDKSQVNFGGLGVLDHVVEGFLGGEKDIVAQTRWQRPARQLQRDVNPGANARRPQKLVAQVGQVTDQTLQRVVPRTDGPDDFVEFLRQVDGHRAQPLRVLPGRMGGFDFP